MTLELDEQELVGEDAAPPHLDLRIDAAHLEHAYPRCPPSSGAVNQLRALERPAESSSSIMMHRELATTLDRDPLPAEHAINQPGIIELRSAAFVPREFAPMIALHDAERALPRNLDHDLRSDERLILSAPRLVPRDDSVLLYVVAHGSPVSRISDDPVTIERGLPPGSACPPRFGPYAEAVLRVLACEARGENSRQPALGFERVRRRLGARIRGLGAARKLTQEVVADRIDVSQTCVSELERGQRSPSWETLIGIAHQGFEIKLASLMFGIDEDIEAEVQGIGDVLAGCSAEARCDLLRALELVLRAAGGDGREKDRTGAAASAGSGSLRPQRPYRSSGRDDAHSAATWVKWTATLRGIIR